MGEGFRAGRLGGSGTFGALPSTLGLGQNVAAHSVCSPPPYGVGVGGGGSNLAHLAATRRHPLPTPPPQGGRSRPSLPLAQIDHLAPIATVPPGDDSLCYPPLHRFREPSAFTAWVKAGDDGLNTGC